MVIQWRDDYSVGVALFDDHHKQLIGIINELHSVIELKTTEKKIRLIFSKLVEYSQHHFDSEETLMEQHAYPSLAKQKKEHQRFVEQLKDFRKRHDIGEVDVDRKLFDYLKGWMLDHIVHEDKLYSKFFNSKGVY